MMGVLALTTKQTLLAKEGNTHDIQQILTG